MALNPAARILHLRFVSGGIAADRGLYGSGTYGDLQSYGEEVGESAITGVRYELMPYPGWHPGRAAWIYRVGDTEEPFVAVIGNYEDPMDRLDVTSIHQAMLVLREVSLVKKPWMRAFPLFTNEAQNTLDRTWHESDLTRAGEFAATIRVLFNSGRYMTIEAQDDTTFLVTGSAEGTGI
jgi:hypothetical protein